MASTAGELGVKYIPVISSGCVKKCVDKQIGGTESKYVTTANRI
jgi:hypothetical protein